MTHASTRTSRRTIGATAAALAVIGSLAASQTPAHASAVGDSFNAPTFIAGVRGGITLSNVGAGGEAGEPSHSTSLSGVVDPPDRSIWFRWKSPVNGRVVFRTRGSTFDTVMAAYTGTSLAGLTRVATNDDTTFARADGGRDQLQSQFGFKAVKDTTYSIAVDSFTGSRTGDDIPTGKVKLSWDANDNFANAQALPTSGTQTLIAVGDNTGATRQPGEPDIRQPADVEPAHASIWYSFKAPKAGQVRFTTTGSEIDTILGVFKGTSVADLTTLALTNGPGATEQTTVAVSAGQVLKISLDGVTDITDEGIVLLNYGYTA